MRIKRYRVLVLIMILSLLVTMLPLPVAAAEVVTVPTPAFTPNCKSAVLMEASTGKVLYAHNPAEAMPPASVTKIMTLLLVMECMDAGTITWEDTVTASAHAASMGGSQIYLKEGEQMSARDLIKSVVIASANDAAVALAEHTYGTEESFVARMNQRAAELGMTNTHFENTNGLDDTAQNHVTSAGDIAIMSRELIKHTEILEFSSTWMDTIRDGQFGLTNTNRLVRFYRGCNGLKTGSTAKAGFCVSVTAEREGMTLICVIMGAENRDIRNAEAQKLLDWGFSTYGLFVSEAGKLGPVPVAGGKQDEVSLTYPRFTAVLPKGELSAVEFTVSLPKTVSAPVRKGEAVGMITYTCKGNALGEVAILSHETVDKITFLDLWGRILKNMLGVG